MSALVLQPPERTSPTLWTHMRLCSLRAVLAVTPASSEWVLHDPRAWLGTAFHCVMGAVRSGLAPGDMEPVWEAAVASAAQKAGAHPFDRRFSAPERWPSYFLVRQRSLSLAREALARRPAAKPSSAKNREELGPLRAERRFEARNGRLVGKPDYYDGRTITDYKSSLPDVGWPGAAEVTEGFQRQLRLYAAIIAEATGKRPEAARIVAASGKTLDVPVHPAECDAEADAAVTALDSVIARFRTSVSPRELARVTTSSCSRCPFKIICPSFWEGLRGGALTPLAHNVMEGVFDSVEDGPDGDLYSVTVTSVAGAGGAGGFQTLVLRKSVHGFPGQPFVGKHFRAVDIYTRSDGRVRADTSTVIAATDGIPQLTNRPFGSAS